MRTLLIWTLGMSVGVAAALLSHGRFELSLNITHRLDLGELVKDASHE